MTTPIQNPLTGQHFAGNIIPQSMLSPVAQKLLQLLSRAEPAPAPRSNLRATRTVVDDADQVLFRGDQNLGNKVRLYVRYNWFDTYTSDLEAVPVTGITQPRINKNTLVSYTHTLSPSLHNDFRIGYHRIDFDTLNYFSVNGIERAGTDLGIPGFDGDTRFEQPGHPEHQHQQLQRPRRRRHQLVPVRHDVPDVERARLHARVAQHPHRLRPAPAGDRPPRRQRSARRVQVHR